MCSEVIQNTALMTALLATKEAVEIYADMADHNFASGEACGEVNIPTRHCLVNPEIEPAIASNLREKKLPKQNVREQMLFSHDIHSISDLLTPLCDTAFKWLLTMCKPSYLNASILQV